MAVCISVSHINHLHVNNWCNKPVDRYTATCTRKSYLCTLYIVAKNPPSFCTYISLSRYLWELLLFIKTTFVINRYIFNIYMLQTRPEKSKKRLLKNPLSHIIQLIISLNIFTCHS
jgi:hypothetical protein